MPQGFHLWVLMAVMLLTSFVYHANSNHVEDWQTIEQCAARGPLNDCD